MITDEAAARLDDANLSCIAAQEERELLRKNNLQNCLQIAALQEALLKAEQTIEQLRGEVERLTLQAAACMTATFQNTHESKKERIGRDNPYWTQAYDDVCTAVDREIREREAKDQLSARVKVLESALTELVATFGVSVRRCLMKILERVRY
jgi:chromosome segregation ATPase